MDPLCHPVDAGALGERAAAELLNELPHMYLRDTQVKKRGRHRPTFFSSHQDGERYTAIWIVELLAAVLEHDQDGARHLLLGDEAHTDHLGEVGVLGEEAPTDTDRVQQAVPDRLVQDSGKEPGQQWMLAREFHKAFDDAPPVIMFVPDISVPKTITGFGECKKTVHQSHGCSQY